MVIKVKLNKKKVTSAYKQDDAIKYYLKDAEKNPLIFIDDLMLVENVVFQILRYNYGELLSKYSVEVKDLSIDANKCLVSMHYICHVMVDESPSNKIMKTDIDIAYKNIPFASSYFLGGDGKYNLSMWIFVPEYGFNLESKRTLSNYFNNLTHDWSIKGTYFSDMVTNGEDDIIEINLDNDHHSPTEDITSDTLMALTNSINSNTSSYFDNVPVAADYDLIYDSANEYMHLDQSVTITKGNYAYLYFGIDLSKYEADIKSKIKIELLQDGTPFINCQFFGKFNDMFYNFADFDKIEDQYFVKEIDLAKTDKIILSIPASDEIDDFNLQVSFID